MEQSGFSKHDHSACQSGGLAAAEARCAKEGLQLTPVRRRVLEILFEAHRAMGAYEILDRLSAEGLGSQPPVAYRALDFLVTNGFAHKIERANAFVACSHLSHEHIPVFLICRDCKAVAEGQAELEAGNLARVARETGFQIERTVTEAEGLCPNCQNGDTV